MTVTEAAACGTPAVVTDIAGHRRRRAVAGSRASCHPIRPPSLVTSARCSTTERRVNGCGARALARARRAHVGSHGHGHARRARREATRLRPSGTLDLMPARWRGRATAPRPRCWSRTSRCCSPTAARSSADTKTYLYLDPSRLLAKAPYDVGPEHRPRHGHPPEHRLPVPDGALLLAHADASGSPTGSRNGSGSARSCSLAGAGVRFLLRTIGWTRRHRRSRAVVVAAASTCSRPYVLDYCRRGISVILLPFAALPVAASRHGDARSAARADGATRRCSRSSSRSSAASTRPRCSSRASARALDPVRHVGRRARSPLRRALGGGRPHRCADDRLLAVVDRRPLGAGRYGIHDPPVHRDRRDGRDRVSSRPRCSAASATGSSTATTSSARGSSRASTTPSTSGSSVPATSWRSVACSLPELCGGSSAAYFVALLAIGTIIAVGAHPFDDPTP